MTRVDFAGATVLQLAKDIAQIDPEQVQDLHGLLMRLARQSAAAAKKALIIPLIGLALSSLAIVGLILYMRVNPSPPRWPLLTSGALLVVASVVLLAYAWIFVQVFRVPDSIAQLSDLILNAIHACRSVDFTDDSETGTWRRRFRMLRNFGRVAVDLRTLLTDEKHARVSGPIQAATLMAVPFFWLGLVAAMILSVITAFLVPLVCLLHYLFT